MRKQSRIPEIGEIRKADYLNKLSLSLLRKIVTYLIQIMMSRGDEIMAYRGSKKHTDYMNKWRGSVLRGYSFFLHREKDKSVIERLDGVGNKTDYIRQLILKDIRSSH